MLDEPPAREGFLEREEYRRLLSVLPEYVRPIFTFAYKTGMRLNELKALTWGNVHRREGIIRLDASQTKSGKERKIPFGPVPELADIIEQLWQKATDVSGLVFVRAKGRPLGSFRKAWIRACIKAGQGRMLWECRVCHATVEVVKQPWPPECPEDEPPRCPCGATYHWKYAGRIFHDLRRTAVRNLRRAGVPESIAMQISGHQSREVFERYNIKSEKDVIEAMERLEVFQRAEDATIGSSTVRPN
jgi:integrase